MRYECPRKPRGIGGNDTIAFGKILVPTDGSKNADAAIDVAIELAKLADAKITALYVVDRTTVTEVTREAYSTVTAILNDEGVRAVEHVKEKCEAAGVPVGVAVEGGHVADLIVEWSEDFDIIVMSTLGKSGLSKYLIGSVAEKVVKMAKCKVLTIRSQ